MTCEAVSLKLSLSVLSECSNKCLVLRYNLDVG